MSETKVKADVIRASHGRAASDTGCEPARDENVKAHMKVHEPSGCAARQQLSLNEAAGGNQLVHLKSDNRLLDVLIR